MRCKNCLHEAELHDLDEGFCGGTLYQRCDPNIPDSPSVPVHCDCPVFEPEFETPLSGHGSHHKEQRIEIIETLIEVESRSLEERGQKTSKRLRELEQVLSRLHQGTEGSPRENRYVEQDLEYEEDSEREELGSIPIDGRSVSAVVQQKHTTEEDLKARIAQLEKLVASRSCGLEFRIGEKGGVSVYGLGRFPVTLYYEQWIRLLGAEKELRAFLEENRAVDKLKLKQK